MKHIDSLIIGQGLAGSLLAWQLHSRGERVVVVDNDYASSSSSVAAGLINPVTGKRLVKSVGVDACLPRARDTYHRLEQQLGIELLVDKPMLRLLHSGEERERWLLRQKDPAYREYLGELLDPAQLPHPISASHGGGWQLQTAYLRTSQLLHSLREWLQQQGGYLKAQFHHQELELLSEGVRWGEITARRAIFCEGYKGAANPWFHWLPFQPAKGEFLTLRCGEALPDCIINSGRWLMPRGGGLYRAGATYDHKVLDETISKEARQLLLAALPEFLSPSPHFEVVEQKAGVRPTTSDRQPFVGAHPHHAQLLIFNGFGSKGSLLIPWHAERFVDYLCDGEALPGAIDVLRYRELADG